MSENTKQSELKVTRKKTTGVDVVNLKSKTEDAMAKLVEIDPQEGKSEYDDVVTRRIKVLSDLYNTLAGEEHALRISR